MASVFEEAWPTVLLHEGSKFTNIPGDPGGATKFGITLRNAKANALDIDNDGDTDDADIKGLTEQDAKEYYHKFWWKVIYEDFADQAVATKYFDTAINVGEYKACLWLQQTCNQLGGYRMLEEDGHLGRKTIDAVNKFRADVLLHTYRQTQADFYSRWVDAKLEAREKFRAGLLNRASS